MSGKEQTMCIIGDDKIRLSEEDKKFLEKRVWEELDDALEKGIDTIYFGAVGEFDIFCANVALERRKVIDYENPIILEVTAVLACEEQIEWWAEENKKYFYNTLLKCPSVIKLSDNYHERCIANRDESMVNFSCRVIDYEGMMGKKPTV